MMEKKVKILTWHDLSSAYSCILYLRNELEKFSEVTIWSKTDSKVMPYKYKRMYSFLDTFYGKIPKVRNIIAQCHMFFTALIDNTNVYIINDLDFFIPLYFVKKIKKKTQVIHYNTEIPGKDVRYPHIIEKFYEKHADYPDMIIECLKERAEWRKSRFNINKKIYVIDNTIPAKNIPKISGTEYEDVQFNNDNPIVIYSGRTALSRQLEEVLECVQTFKDSLNFVFFCFGKGSELEQLERYLKEHCDGNNYKLNKPLPRTELHKRMQFCDIGINYYVPEFSINHKYAAPTKFYEYIACGLNVVSTNNEGINKIIENNNIGVCIKQKENMEDAIKRLLEKGLNDRESIRKTFEEKYCYEISSFSAIQEIKKIVNAV